MKQKFYFLIALHFHQPVGNFDFVIEKACARCYEPFLDTISKFPDIKFNLHYSGCLLEWFKRRRPDILARIRRRVKAGQVELLGGGFYDPILTVLPPEDSCGQIDMLSRFLKDEFGVSVSGAWLAERVWEPHLAKVFSNTGIRYTVVDDTHLRYAGLSQSQLYGYYITEEDGQPLAVFPSDKFLRYSIPFRSHKFTINYFLKVKNEYKRHSVLYGDDGEKFGEWPGTAKSVYKKKWLYNFLKLLRDNSSWLKTEKISDYMKIEEPQGRIYMPAASYQEMNEWALPAESSKRLEDILKGLKQQRRLDRYIDFIRGGIWRNFLVKYPEANQMHKRMMLVSERLRRLQVTGNRLQVSGSRLSLLRLRNAKRELFRCQCNCAYWHGRFGGLYLYHLRTAVYEHLISADRMLDAIEYKKKSWIKVDESDFDCDGQSEFIVSTPQNTFIVERGEGGTITEWDIKDRSVNIINTLARRKEAYHRKLTSKKLYYDSCRRLLFADHFLPANLTLRQASRNLYSEQGDFINNPYHTLKAQAKNTPYIRLGRKGFVNKKPLRIIKRFSFYPQKNSLGVQYELINLSLSRLKLHFAPELNFSLTHDDINEELSSIDNLLLYDNVQNLKIELKFSPKADRLFRYRVCTISQSERDIEENYQATCVLPIFHIEVGRKKKASLRIDISVT